MHCCQDGVISGDELFGYLRTLLAPSAASDAQLCRVVRATLAAHDTDADGALSVRGCGASDRRAGISAA
jgi:hypothetical protein